MGLILHIFNIRFKSSFLSGSAFRILNVWICFTFVVYFYMISKIYFKLYIYTFSFRQKYLKWRQMQSRLALSWNRESSNPQIYIVVVIVVFEEWVEEFFSKKLELYMCYETNWWLFHGIFNCRKTNFQFGYEVVKWTDNITRLYWWL